MTNGTFTITDLRRILRECAGEDEAAELYGDISQSTFDELGYDSLALMETASRVTQELAVAIPEGELASVGTPAEFVELVNRQLAEA
ncbi:acyl carrier protein [Nonomuraea sp. NPDC049158]|uniref:acyl carrier protein n=1 Tax=Nonomuraea sp. NPDC049158 TaxID=3155649 RepID=UPI0033EBB7CE